MDWTDWFFWLLITLITRIYFKQRITRIERIDFGNNIEVDPFRQRAVCKANLLIAQGIALGIVHAREDAL